MLFPWFKVYMCGGVCAFVFLCVCVWAGAWVCVCVGACVSVCRWCMSKGEGEEGHFYVHVSPCFVVQASLRAVIDGSLQFVQQELGDFFTRLQRDQSISGENQNNA